MDLKELTHDVQQDHRESQQQVDLCEQEQEQEQEREQEQEQEEEEEGEQIGASAGSSDQISIHGFASEHSDHEDEQDEVEAEASATEYMVDKLYEQLIVQFHGCSHERHEDQLREHMESAGDNHHGLNEVFNDTDFPSVLGLSGTITAERLAREQPPSATRWEAMFCGTDRRQRWLRNGCLYKEEIEVVVAKVVSDVDSFSGFGTSLVMVKKGIWC